MLHYWPILLLAPGGRQIDPNIDGVERPPWHWVDAKGIGSTLLVLNPPHRSVSPKNKPDGANAAPFRSSTAHSAFNSFLLPLPPPAPFCRHSAAVRERRVFCRKLMQSLRHCQSGAAAFSCTTPL